MKRSTDAAKSISVVFACELPTPGSERGGDQTQGCGEAGPAREACSGRIAGGTEEIALAPACATRRAQRMHQGSAESERARTGEHAGVRPCGVTGAGGGSSTGPVEAACAGRDIAAFSTRRRDVASKPMVVSVGGRRNWGSARRLEAVRCRRSHGTAWSRDLLGPGCGYISAVRGESRRNASNFRCAPCQNYRSIPPSFRLRSRLPLWPAPLAAYLSPLRSC